MRNAFNRVLRVSAAVIAALFICAAVVEWFRSAYPQFNGFKDFSWINGLRNFLYLMTMFNIIVIRYAVTRVYQAEGPVNNETVINRLVRADIISMLLSGLPCVYGFILFLIAGDPVDFYLLFGLSIIYIMIFFPRYKKWNTIFEQNTVVRLNEQGGDAQQTNT